MVTWLGDLDPAEHKQLLTYLGVTRATLWRWKQAPGTVPVEAADTITQYLGAIRGHDFTISQLFGLKARQFGHRIKTSSTTKP